MAEPIEHASIFMKKIFKKEKIPEGCYRLKKFLYNSFFKT